MKETVVVLRVNGGKAYAYFQVFTRDVTSAGICAKVHLAAKLGAELY